MEMQLPSAFFKSGSRSGKTAVLLLATSALALSGCNAAKTLSPQQTITNGYVVDDQMLELVPVGSSREQVVLALGSPSTTATFENETYYYISQTRKRGAAFMRPKLVDQRILAVYFGPDDRVSNIANYGLKDGKVFDFISRTTPTGGKELSFLAQVLAGVGKLPSRFPGT